MVKNHRYINTPFSIDFGNFVYKNETVRFEKIVKNSNSEGTWLGHFLRPSDL